MALLALTSFLFAWAAASLAQRRRQHRALLQQQGRTERALARNAVVLQGLTRLQREALLDNDIHQVFDRMLKLLLEASASPALYPDAKLDKVYRAA